MQLKQKEPWFFENSKIPVWLSKLAPINIWAISFGLWVWCRGEMSERTKRHETIHFQQQLELLFVGQWVLYITFWLIGLIRYRDGKKAYRENPFEREAFDNDEKPNYLRNRARWAWVLHIFRKNKDGK